jgi:hypothetical protein
MLSPQTPYVNPLACRPAARKGAPPVYSTKGGEPCGAQRPRLAAEVTATDQAGVVAAAFRPRHRFVVPSGCRQASRRVRCRSPVALTTTRASRRGRPEGARLPFLPRLRFAGLLHRADGAGSRRRLGRLVRRPVVPAADGVRLRLSPSPVGGAARQRGVLREPRRPDGRRGRAPRPGDPDVGGLSRDGERGLRLRSDPRRGRLPGARRPLRPQRTSSAVVTSRSACVRVRPRCRRPGASRSKRRPRRSTRGASIPANFSFRAYQVSK